MTRDMRKLLKGKGNPRCVVVTKAGRVEGSRYRPKEAVKYLGKATSSGTAAVSAMEHPKVSLVLVVVAAVAPLCHATTCNRYSPLQFQSRISALPSCFIL